QGPGQRVGAGGQGPGAEQVLGLDVDRGAAGQEAADLGAGERAEPALVGQGGRLGGAAEELLELEVEADIAVVDRQAARPRPAPGPPPAAPAGALAGLGRRRNSPAALSAAKVG